MKRFIILIFLPALLWAQDLEFRLETNTIPVTIEGWAPYVPWGGGESESAPALCDINADGDLDFFLGNFWGRISYFENYGSSVNADFSLITLNYAQVNLGGTTYAGRTAPAFCDLDNDGDFDLFTGDFRGLIHYWQNVGTSLDPQFVFITDTLAGIDADGFSKIDFKDLDADGDYDLLLGDYFGFVWLYQNTGNAQVYNFQLPPQQLAGIDVGYNANPCLIDIDADGDYDLFIGEEYGEIWFYRNDGDSVNYNFTYVTNAYSGIDAGDYSSPEFADIDGDGDYDLFVGREANPASLIGDVFFYENVGTPQNAQFQLVARSYLMLDFSIYEPRPQFIDIDADGDKDMIAGAGNVLDYFENIGDSLQPEFLFMGEGYQGISLPTIEPFLVDVDADGDYDLISGQGAIPGPPSLALYLNQGTPRNPNFQLYSNQFVTNPDFFVLLVPGLADIDADGDQDLFIFDSHDRFYYYQNNGTALWPNFQLITNQWQGIHQFPYPDDSWYGFTFADLDEDGDLDLLIGSPDQDNLYFYRNQGTPQVPQMVLETETLLPGSYPYVYTPYLVDIDSDQDYDLFVGHTNGGILFFRNVTGDTSAVAPPPVQQHPRAGLQISLGPNPANPLVVASFELRVASNMSLEVYDLLGRRVAELASGFHLPGEYRYVWDAGKNASGIYIIRLKTPQESLSEKLMIVK